jgi:hypothetical protein
MTFPALRQSLLERGLIDAEHRLTPAGNVYVDEMLRELPRVVGVRRGR